MLIMQVFDIPIFPSGGFRGKGPLGLEGVTDPAEAGGVFNKFISTTIGVMTIIAMIWFIVQFFSGAVAIVTSGGDKQKLSEAKGKITSALIGLIVVVAAIFLIELIGKILGIDLILNPADFVSKVWNP